MNKEQELIKAAKAAAQNAWAPYSNFKVGAAVLTAQDCIFAGCNVENASYGLTMCAERTALFAAVSAGQYQLQSMVIFTATDIPFYPCGACRQVISEFNPHLPITVIWNKGKEYLNLKDLLPNQFKI